LGGNRSPATFPHRSRPSTTMQPDGLKQPYQSAAANNIVDQRSYTANPFTPTAASRASTRRCELTVTRINLVASPSNSIAQITTTAQECFGQRINPRVWRHLKLTFTEPASTPKLKKAQPKRETEESLKRKEKNKEKNPPNASRAPMTLQASACSADSRYNLPDQLGQRRDRGSKWLLRHSVEPRRSFSNLSNRAYPSGLHEPDQLAAAGSANLNLATHEERPHQRCPPGSRCGVPRGAVHQSSSGRGVLAALPALITASKALSSLRENPAATLIPNP